MDFLKKIFAPKKDLIKGLKNIFGLGRNYGGLIAHLNLVDFWSELTEEEREKIRDYHTAGFDRPDIDVDDSEFTSDHPDFTSDYIKEISRSASKFLYSMADWAISSKEYDLAEKILNKALEESSNPVDLHYTYDALIKLYYQLRDRQGYLEKCIEICHYDIDLYENLLREKEEFQDEGTKIPAFRRLAIIYEKQEKYQKALEIARKASSYGLSDTTKTGFSGRIERLEKKI